MPLGECVQGFPGNELLCDLPLELDTVGAVSGHGFHPSKAQPPCQFTNLNLSGPRGALQIDRPKSTRMTHLRHRLAFHAAVAKPVSAPIKVLVRAGTMPSPEPRGRHEAAGISRCSGCSSSVAACSARTASGASGDRVPRFPLARGARGTLAQIP